MSDNHLTTQAEAAELLARAVQDATRDEDGSVLIRLRVPGELVDRLRRYAAWMGIEGAEQAPAD